MPYGWRPAFLARNGNKVQTSGAASSLLVLTTLFYGNSVNNTVSVGRGFKTQGLLIRIEGSGNKVTIGENVNWSGQINLFGFDVHVTIGDRSDAKKVSLTAREASIAIGSDCLLARGTDIRSSDIHSIFDRNTGEHLNPSRSVEVGNRVWIGRDSSVLKGARVADDCVVGTRSLVTGCFDEPGCVVAGAPAHVVRTGIYWKR